MTTTNGDVFKACAIKICLTRVDNIEKYKKQTSLSAHHSGAL